MPEYVCSYSQMETIPCLVLLGEPGVGKTYALKEIEQREKNAGREVLKLDLGAYMTEDGFTQDLKQDEDQSWCFLLDGLDECSIKPKALDRVLKKVLATIPARHRRLRITCRTTQWPEMLEHSFKNLWGNEHVATYVLTPLQYCDVVEAARARKISEEHFIEAVSQAGAHPLALKPVTLEFLLNTFENDRSLPPNESQLYRDGLYALCQETEERIDVGQTRTCDASQTVNHSAEDRVRDPLFR